MSWGGKLGGGGGMEGQGGAEAEEID